MKIIIDTNIVFSGILNSTGKIGKILLYSKDHFNFYSCNFLQYELEKHHNRLIKLTNLSSEKLSELVYLVTKKIIFINEEIIPKRKIIAAEKLLIDIDLDDVPFVALTQHIKGKLWTRDKKLIKGLKAKGFNSIITTERLSDILDRLEKKK